MCGITGFVTRGDARCWRDDLPKAISAIRHRGPDDSGQWSETGVGLGHRRLSILDLTEHGHQPMVSRDGRFVMVFNGEVYNFADIRRRLESHGHSFEGTGDSEVILAAFRQWGKEAVRQFIGMFAIAFWDKQERTLTLIRDRLGVKPLYYGWDGTTLFFGSELKALRAFKAWQPDIDRDGLSDYFRFGFINGPRTIYKRVSKLLPGHSLELRDGGEPLTQPYWSILDVVDAPLTGSEEGLTEQLEALMIDAFKLRMISDVPVGMFLSGGIDSSLVTAILQRHFGTQVHTFTIGFNEKKYNEAPHARLVAEHLGTHHTERVLETLKPRPSFRNGAPCTMSPLPTLPASHLSRLPGGREQVKVVLSADGGDELFSGYNVYSEVLSHVARRARIPGPLGRRLSPAESGAPGQAGRMGRPVSAVKAPAQGSERSAHRPARRVHAYLPRHARGNLRRSNVLLEWGDLARLTYGREYCAKPPMPIRVRLPSRCACGTCTTICRTTSL